jgi:hypothetical protein
MKVEINIKMKTRKFTNVYKLNTHSWKTSGSKKKSQEKLETNETKTQHCKNV